MEAKPRKAYPSDVSDEEWAFVAPYLTLITEEAPQRVYELREVYNSLRYIARTGAPWRWLPNDLPPWPVVYQQTQRWLKAEVFQAMVHDLREMLRMAQGRNAEPTLLFWTAAPCNPLLRVEHEPGTTGPNARKGSKVHVARGAVDTLGHLLALLVTPANEGIERR